MIEALEPLFPWIGTIYLFVHGFYGLSKLGQFNSFLSERYGRKSRKAEALGLVAIALWLASGWIVIRFFGTIF